MSYIINSVTGPKNSTDTNVYLFVDSTNTDQPVQQLTLVMSLNQFYVYLKQNYIYYTTPLDYASVTEKLKGKEIAAETTPVGKDPTTATVKQVTGIYNPHESQAHEWPEGEKTSPFTPIIHPELEPGQFRMGYAIVTAPVTHFSSSRSTHIAETSNLRSESSIKTTYGLSYESYDMSWMAVGKAGITNSVKNVFEQLAVNPFICCEGGPFGYDGKLGDIPTKEIAVRSFGISTVPNQPNCLQVNISFDPFLWDWYTPQRTSEVVNNEITPARKKLEDGICYPLYKLWCKQVGKSRYNPPTSGSAYNGNFVLRYPDDETVYRMQNKVFLSYTTPAKDVDTYNDILSAVKGTGVIGTNVKKISSNGQDLLIVKVNDSNAFTQLTGLTYNGSDWIGTLNTSFVGLQEWNNFSVSFADNFGARILGDPLVDITGSVQLNSGANNTKPTTVFKPDVIITNSLVTSLTSYFTSQEQARYEKIVVGPYSDHNSTLFTTVSSAVSAEMSANVVEPFNRFAVVLNPKAAGFQNQITKLNQNKSNQALPPTLESTVRDGILSSQTDPILAIKGGSAANKGISITSISAVKYHSLSSTNTQHTPLPVHQFLGTRGTKFVVQGYCRGTENRNLLHKVKADFDEKAIKRLNSQYSPEYNKTQSNYSVDKTTVPFMVVENEIFQLMGIDFVMPLSINIDTVEGHPRLFSWTMEFMDFDPKVKAEEQVKYLPTYNQVHQNLLHYAYQGGTDTHPIVLKALDWFSLQGALANIEVYPDLHLPSNQLVQEWLTLCRDIALSRTSNNAPPLTARHREVERIIEPYIGAEHLKKINLEPMAKWGKWDKKTSFYADPDFFYYYHEMDSFNNLVDQVAEGTLGKRKANLSADPTTATSNIRLVDQQYPDHTSLLSGLQVGASKATANTHGKEATTIFDPKTGKKNTKPVDDYNEVVAKGRAIGKSMGWWVGDQVFEEGGYKYVPISSDAYNPQAELPQDAAGQAEGKSLENVKIVDSKQDFLSAYWDFWSLGWRSRQLQEFCNLGKQIKGAKPASEWGQDLTTGNFLLPSRDRETFGPFTALAITNDLNWKVSTEAYYFQSTEPINHLELIHSGLDWYQIEGNNGNQTVLSIDDWSQCIKSITPKLALSGGDLVNGQNVLPDLSKDQTDDLGSWTQIPSYLQRCSLINSYYLNNNLYSPWTEADGSIHGIAIANENLFNYYGKKNNIDPNLIRGYFIARSSFGTAGHTNPNFSGFGLFDQSQPISQGKVKAEECIDLFCTTFKSNLALYSKPSLALIATNIELTGGANPNVQSTYDYVGEFKKLSSTPNDQLRATIQGLCKNGSIQNGHQYDGYLESWLECSRVLGAIDMNYSDPFFSLDNPYLVMDVGGNQDNRTIVTSQGFSSDSFYILAERAKIKAPVTVQLHPDSKLDPEQKFDSQARVREALSPDSEDAVHGALLDFRRYSPYSRLIGAYPSYLCLFINEGFFYNDGNKKLWDVYYTRGNIRSIEVFRTRTSPADVATVCFSNVFHTLTRYVAQEAFQQQLNLEQKEYMVAQAVKGNLIKNILTEQLFKEPTAEDRALLAQNYLNIFTITPGARLHIRMGYGSDPSKLPVIFNGTIAEVQSGGDMVEVRALGDGAELQKNSVNNLHKVQSGWAYNDGGALLGSGKSPASMVVDTMVNIDFWKNILAGTLDNNFFRDFSHGISHFGDVYHDGYAWYPTELQTNIYDSSLTSMEQNVPANKNVFETSAFFDWTHGKNYFSISVQEPTPWKVIKTCTNAVFDFVCAAEPFQTTNTLFFGKWWWPMNYAYKQSILDFNLYKASQATNQLAAITDKVDVNVETDLNKVITTPDNKLTEKEKSDLIYQSRLVKSQNATFKSVGGLKPLWGHGNVLYDAWADSNTSKPPVNPIDQAKADLVTFDKNLEAHQQVEQFKDVDYLVSHMYSKPYSQFYCISSHLNLIQSDITADADMVHTDAIGSYTYNGMLTGDDITKTMVFCVDDNIQSVDRKTLLVDTNLVTTALQRGWKGLSQLVVERLPGANAWTTGTPTTQGVHNGVVTALVESVKEMYQGWFVVTGLPSLKPNDLMSYNDQRTGLGGLLGVKEVIHKLDGEVGLVTLVSPDCVAIPRTCFQGSRFLMGVGTQTASKIGAIWAIRATWVSARHGFSLLTSGTDGETVLSNLLFDASKQFISKVNVPGQTADLTLGIEAETKKADDLKEKIGLLKKSGATPINENTLDTNVVQLKDLEQELRDVESTIQKAKKEHDALISMSKSFEFYTAKEAELETDLSKLTIANTTFNTAEDIEKFKAARRIQFKADFYNKEIAGVAKVLNQDNIAKIGDLDEAKKRLQIAQDIYKAASHTTHSTNEINALKAAVNDGEKTVEALTKGVDVSNLSGKDLQILIDTLGPQGKEIREALKSGKLGASLLQDLKNIPLSPGKVAVNTAKAIPGGLVEGFKSVGATYNKVIDVLSPSAGMNVAGKGKFLLDAIKSATIGTAQVAGAADGVQEYKIVSTVKKILTSGKDIYNTAKLSISLTGVPELVLQAVMLMIGNGLIDSFNEHLSVRKCVKIFPLFSQGVPWVAGIRGHQGVVVGDDPSWLDKVIQGTLTGDPTTPLIGENAQIGGFLAGILDISVPDWMPSIPDQEYVKAVNPTTPPEQ